MRWTKLKTEKHLAAAKQLIRPPALLHDKCTIWMTALLKEIKKEYRHKEKIQGRVEEVDYMLVHSGIEK